MRLEKGEMNVGDLNFGISKCKYNIKTVFQSLIGTGFSPFFISIHSIWL